MVDLSSAFKLTEPLEELTFAPFWMVASTVLLSVLYDPMPAPARFTPVLPPPPAASAKLMFKESMEPLAMADTSTLFWAMTFALLILERSTFCPVFASSSPCAFSTNWLPRRLTATDAPTAPLTPTLPPPPTARPPDPPCALRSDPSVAANRTLPLLLVTEAPLAIRASVVLLAKVLYDPMPATASCTPILPPPPALTATPKLVASTLGLKSAMTEMSLLTVTVALSMAARTVLFVTLLSATEAATAKLTPTFLLQAAAKAAEPPIVVRVEGSES